MFLLHKNTETQRHRVYSFKQLGLKLCAFVSLLSFHKNGLVRKVDCKSYRPCHPELVEGSQGTAKETINRQQCSETLQQAQGDKRHHINNHI